MYRKIYSHANSIRVLMMMMMIYDDHTYIHNIHIYDAAAAVQIE